ncbi:Integral membrane protein, putative [Trichomonas vaginalis G3]|uniref:Integral membrane protein, putative n=1 Tax=Trichomonas vaginalis (strain ATCC PRA-98 / G3) TaxID=412133 RepID=A2DWA6_TRIV3|nr:inner membrane transporter family [Trichomonas vaginalis G3]EAY15246.1 Integral membrane protein, putative [Trichomonas vaginalis G3]KAI5526450.1 inner membrane transporter family [Trichomonas vaginalis G3]|eukprot:XP_001327469.1 Integral membrane protein [Trichomonas vaginalis G3]
MSLVRGYISFTILCFCYGTSYAVTSLLIGKVNDSAFALARSFAAALAATGYLFFKLRDPQYKQKALQSLRSGETNFFLSFCGGIFFLGIPITLIIIAQNKVPSFIVIISQPTVPFFSMIAAHFMTSDEKINFHNLLVQLCAIFGAVLTLVPSLSFSGDNSESDPFSYILLLIALILFSIGSIYIKIYLASSDFTLSCTFSTYGAFCYSALSAFYRAGFVEVFKGIGNMFPFTIIAVFIIGVIYNGIPTFLFMDVVMTLGAVKAQLTNFGQIIIGVFVGVTFLGEWDGYAPRDVQIVCCGLVFIIAAMVADLLSQVQKNQLVCEINYLALVIMIVFTMGAQLAYAYYYYPAGRVNVLVRTK